MSTETKQAPISLDDLREPQEVAPQSSPSPEVQPEVTPSAEATPEPAPEVIPSQETTPEVTPEPPAGGDPVPVAGVEESLKYFSDLLDEEFTSADQIVERFKTPTMKTEYDDLKTQHDDLKSKFDLLVEQTDPATIFSSEDAMRLEMWKKDNPTKDASVAQKIFATEDLDSVSDLDMVKMGWKFANASLPGTEKDLENAIAEQLQVDPDTPIEEWPTSAQIRLSSIAGGYKDQFKGVKQGVKLPERFDIEKLRTERQETADAAKVELTDTWTKHAATTASTMKKLKVPVGAPKEGEDQQFFEWDLKVAPTDKVEAMAKTYVDMGVGYTDDTKGLFDRAVRNVLLEENMSQILQKYGDDLLARQQEANIKETHNADPLTDSVRPKEGSAEAALKERTAWAGGSNRSSSFSNPLFKFKTE